ncbi:hypothetical protein CCR94_18225 [Rhodoblastus sphagnicola]|uniref:Uncharacterized protein n=1 Tax=Rhodoblastus sphagnicola TaxID=333368 RepID=A0A2S6N0X2_9HYPH|nr:hypothetical protein [Rhodoblastus sphagnicola]MBB4200592.1 hypothetical protein [Rhodoblastus sphagnicola]PPQ28236.1 hypothetical protein CCR94_18225 [Rhodoblastus sphagnicola]
MPACEVTVEFCSIDPRDPMGPRMFVAHWFAHVIEHRRRHFVRYRETMDFAERKATKTDVVRDHIPAEARNLIGPPTTLKA